METSIYSAFTKAFISATASMNIIRVAIVAPFNVYFNSKNVYSTRGRAVVPTIDLVLQNNSVVWRIFGANSMVMCCALDLLIEEKTPKLQLLLEGTSWRMTFYNLIWLHQGLGSAPLLSSAKPHAPTSTSHPIKPFRGSSPRFKSMNKEGAMRP